MTSHFQTIYPASSLLKQYIYCFYIYENNQADFESVHYSFPHTHNAVSIYAGASIEINTYAIRATGGYKGDFTCVLQGKRQSPLLVRLSGVFRRVTIIFKPLGLNHFIDCPLGKILKANPVYFTLWNSPAFTNVVNSLFSEAPVTDRFACLEFFLCQVCKPLSLPELEAVLTRLEDVDNEEAIQTLAQSSGLPLRSFNRLFRLHLGISPVEYRRIARFRHSLESGLFRNELRKLTELSYKHNFYDQADFIRVYKQFTGLSPRTLFNTVTQIGDSHLAFRFLSADCG